MSASTYRFAVSDTGFYTKRGVSTTSQRLSLKLLQYAFFSSEAQLAHVRERKESKSHKSIKLLDISFINFFKFYKQKGTTICAGESFTTRRRIIICKMRANTSILW